MANLRPVLLISLLFIGYLLWVEWQRDYAPAATTNSQSVAQQSSVGNPAQSSGADLPQVGSVPMDSVAGSGDVPVLNDPALPPSSPEEAAPQRQLITVTTDVLALEIDPLGGNIVTSRLLNYPIDLNAPDTKVEVLTQGPGTYHVAQSGLLSRQPASNHTTEYSYAQTEYVLRDGAETLQVPLSWTDASGVEVRKTYTFKRNAYDIAVTHQLLNNSSESWTGSRYDQLQKAQPGDDSGAGFNNPERYSFEGIGFYSPEEKLQKIDFDEAAEEPFQSADADGWLAMIQHYFFAAWVPQAGQVNQYSTQVYAPAGWPRVIARAVSPAVTVAPGQEHTFNSSLYVGPKLQDKLAGIAPGLDLTVNYGIFTVFSAPLFWLLDKIHNYVGNWGWAIVLLTVLIKLGFFKLTEAQYRSMARMRKLQPRIEKLKERYGDDRQAMSQAMMKMYKEEKVNPLGGCLPILVQIPIFIALYWVLLESVELRQAPFILWIDNLSVRDPYFILPLLNAGFMLATQKLTPMVGMDPLQRKMMQAMPLIFAVMFAFFPAGLVLYWATNAGLSLAQQWYITQKIAKED